MSICWNREAADSAAILGAGFPNVSCVNRGFVQMERFYGALAQNGGNKAAALRKAQLETLRRLREKRFRTSSGRALPEHPIFWAPFVIVGEAGEHRPA